MDFVGYINQIFDAMHNILDIQLLSGFTIGETPIDLHIGDLVIFVFVGSLLYRFIVPTIKN